MTGPAALGPDLDSWTLWWDYEGGRFLKLRERIARGSGVATGASREDGDALLARPSSTEVEKEVVPALRRAIASASEAEVVGEALLALAETGASPAETAKLLAGRLSDASVVERATLALGVLGAREGLDPLVSVLEGERGASCRLRTVAAYGIACCGDASTAPRIRGLLPPLLDEPRLTCAVHREPRVALVLAAGLLPGPDVALADSLERYSKNNADREKAVCAQIPPAVARLVSGADAAVRRAHAEAWIAELGAKATPRRKSLRTGCALALGRITREGDPTFDKAIGALRAAIEDQIGKDSVTAHLSLIALGEIAGRSRPGSEIEKFLLAKATTGGGRASVRSWATLALGVAGYEQRERGVSAARDPFSEAIVERLPSLRDPSQSAAAALALGLRGHRASAGEILAALERTKDEGYRGYFALSLGLLGAEGARAPLKAMLAGSLRRPEILRPTAMALAMLGDPTLSTMLASLLADGSRESSAVLGAAADALGFVGDRRAVAPLAALLVPAGEPAPAAVRAAAARALGRIAARDLVPWSERVMRGMNYPAALTLLGL